MISFVLEVFVFVDECLKYTVQRAQLRDYACQWEKNMKREWKQAALWRLLACESIIWPTCAHMCMTQPGSGSWAQGQPAPATLSSTLWFETRRQDADAQKLACELCVSVCVTMSAGLGQTQSLDKNEKNRNFIFCGSDITRHWENKMLSSKKILPWRLCTFRFTVRGHANKIWTVAVLAFLHWLYTVFGRWSLSSCTKALCLTIFTTSCQPKQACFCWTTITTARQLT